MSGSYDTLRDTWIYIEIKREVQAELQQRCLTEQRQMLLEIVQARFPRMEALTKQVIAGITEPEALKELLVKVGTARIEKDARQSIREVPCHNTQIAKKV